MARSNRWILHCNTTEPGKEVQLTDELQRLSISELFAIWRAVVAELKNRAPRTKAAIF
jgi:hypothetical protein